MIKFLFFIFLNFGYGMEIDIPIPSIELNKKKFLTHIENTKKDKKYFIIMNIATNTLRVYSSGDCTECFNTLELQTEMVSGANKKGYRSVLGHFKLLSWQKFYSDNKGNSVSWFDFSYDNPPSSNVPVSEWFSARAAFGFFNAKLKGGSLGSAKAQWLHGSRGWGSDKKKFITRTVFNGKTINWTTSGCSRVDNETIAFLHTIVKKGASVIKIYANEEILDKRKKRYSKEKKNWSYILTADEVRKENPHVISRDYVLKNIPNKYYLEKGIYSYSSYPIKKKVSNIYGAKNLNGVFYVDTGKLLGYRHPTNLKISGLKNLPKNIIID